MVVTVSVIFALCRMPALTMYVASYFSSSQHNRNVLRIIYVALVTSNSAINPFIYAIVNQRFRQHIKELVCCVGTCRNKVNPVVGQDINQNTCNTTQLMQLRKVSDDGL